MEVSKTVVVFQVAVVVVPLAFFFCEDFSMMIIIISPG